MNISESYSWFLDLLFTFFDLFVLKPEKEEKLSEPEHDRAIVLYLHTCGSKWRNLYLACLDCPSGNPMRREAIEYLVSISVGPDRISQAKRLLASELIEPSVRFVEADPDIWKNK
jgi:hypothetical protein